MSEEKEAKKLEAKKVETKKVENKTNTCKSKLCDNSFIVNEKYIQEKFCPVCICAAQTDMIRTYSKQFSTIREAMGHDFIKNLIIDIDDGRTPKEVTLIDGSKGFVFNPKLFQVAVNAGSRANRRNHEKKRRKSRK